MAKTYEGFTREELVQEIVALNKRADERVAERLKTAVENEQQALNRVIIEYQEECRELRRAQHQVTQHFKDSLLEFLEELTVVYSRDTKLDLFGMAPLIMWCRGQTQRRREAEHAAKVLIEYLERG